MAQSLYTVGDDFFSSTTETVSANTLSSTSQEPPVIDSITTQARQLLEVTYKNTSLLLFRHARFIDGNFIFFYNSDVNGS